MEIGRCVHVWGWGWGLVGVYMCGGGGCRCVHVWGWGVGISG